MADSINNEVVWKSGFDTYKSFFLSSSQQYFGSSDSRIHDVFMNKISQYNLNFYLGKI